MGKSYAQTRVAPTSSGGGSADHDLRIRKPNYLRDDMFHNQFENIYSNTNAIQLRAKVRGVEKEFKSLYKKRTGRNPQKGKASAFMQGVITLSNSINEMLENKYVSYEKLNSLFKKALDNQLDKIEDITGTRPDLIEYSIHYDEKTPHLHYLTTNYDQQGRSLHHNLKTSKRLAELQDQVGEDFNSIGFERGERKSTAKHLTVVKMHQEEIKEHKEEIKALKYELRDIIKALKEQKKEIKSTITDKEELKEELKYLDKQLKFAREANKRENEDFGILKQATTLLKADIDELEQEQTVLIEKNKLIVEANENEISLDDIDEFLGEIKELNQVVKQNKNKEPDTEDDWRDQLCEVPDISKSKRYR